MKGTRPKSTCERLLERYNTYSRRPTIADERVRRAVFNSLGRVLGPWLPADRSARILDVGCGEGALLSFLKARGYANLTGCDISPENVAICNGFGLHCVRQWDALRLADMPGLERCDAVFAMDVLEHLPKQEAAPFLEAVRELLRPGGFVVIQTPNMGSLCGCLHRYHDLSHEFGLSEKSAVNLMLLAGFRPERIELRPAWNATTLLGRLREAHLRLLHHFVFAGEGAARPRIPTKNLLIRASVA